MKKKWVLIAACFAAALVIALLAFALVKAGHACANPSKRVALKIVEANGCTEFWLNRYQSAWAGMFSTGAAIFAAVLAWRAVQTQIQQQGRIAAREQILRLESCCEADKLVFARLQKVKIAVITIRDLVAASPDQRKHIAAMDQYRAAGNSHIPLLHMQELSSVMDTDDSIGRVENIFFRAGNAVDLEPIEEALAFELSVLFSMTDSLDAEQNRIVERIRENSDQIEVLRKV